MGNKPNNSVRIRIQNTVMPNVSAITVLGKSIKSNLNVNVHIKRICDECIPRINILKIISSHRSGLEPSKALRIFRSIVRSKIEYTCSSMCNMSASQIKKITTLYNRCIRRCLGLTPDAPVPCLYAIADELPVRERFLWITAKELKAFTVGRNLGALINEGDLSTSYGRVYAIFKDQLDMVETKKNYRISSKFQVKVGMLKDAGWSKSSAGVEAIGQLFLVTKNGLLEDGFRIMATDTSVQPGADGAGLAVVDGSDGISIMYNMNYRVSSTTAELVAIKKALQVANARGYERVALFTDSMAACNLLTKAHLFFFLFNKVK